MRNRRAGIAALLAVIAVLLWVRHPQPSPELDSAAVVTQVRQLNQLATVKYTVQKVVGLKERKQPVGEESILLVIQATVEAGIELSQLKAEDVFKRADGALIVRLPPAKILNVFVDEKSTKVWDREKTWWTPWVPYSVDLEGKARAAGLESVKQGAIEMGILKQAERNAESSIRGLLGLAGITQVVVIPASAT
jgi:hypothetical protein